MKKTLSSGAWRRAVRLTLAPAAAAVIAAVGVGAADSVFAACFSVAVAAAFGAGVAIVFADRDISRLETLLAARRARRAAKAARRAEAPGAAGAAVSEPAAEETLGDLSAAALVLDGLPTALAVIDAQGRVLFANQQLRGHLGRDPIGAPFVTSFRAPDLGDAIRAAVETGAPAEAAFAVRRQRRELHLHAQIHPVQPGAEGGAPTRLVVLLLDQTRMRRADELHRDFVANASHELKTPLTTISGFVETLRGPARDDPEARERFLEIISAQTERMRRLVLDLLSLNRIELNAHVAPADRAPLREIVAAAAAASETHAGQAVEIALPGDLPAALGDPTELTQAFANLIENAHRYGGGKRGPRISADLREDAEEMVGVVVEDFGPGIAAEHLPRLTERFYRVPGATASAGAPQGTGLGLSIVSHIAARHRGELRIESRLGQGSRFTLWLPIYPDERRRSAASDAPATRLSQTAG